jgi:hypothetical protein
MFSDPPFEDWMAHHFDIEGLRDAGNCHVIVSRANAARSEEVVDLGRECPDLMGDFLDDVRDEVDASKEDAKLSKLTYQKPRVQVIGLSAQYFVADHKDRGAWDTHHDESLVSAAAPWCSEENGGKPPYSKIATTSPGNDNE